MRKCPHCRAEANDDAVLCPQCFRRLDAPVSRADGTSRPTSSVAGTVSGLTMAAGFLLALVVYLNADAIGARLRPWIVGDEPAAAREETVAPQAPPQTAASRAAEIARQAAAAEGLQPPADSPPPATSPERPARAPQAPATSPARGAAATTGAARGGAASGAPVRGDQGTPGIAPPIKIHDVRPEYPPEALAARVQGLVLIEATVGVDGRVKDAKVTSAPRQFREAFSQAALDAVRQWRYQPASMNDEPIPVVMTVTANFALR